MRMTKVVGALARAVVTITLVVLAWPSLGGSSPDERPTPSEAQAQAEKVREREFFLQRCMAEYGFDYQPRLEEVRRVADSHIAPDVPDLRNEGYGIATGFDDWKPRELDANDNYYLSLSCEDRETYDAAMYGPYSGSGYPEGWFSDPDHPGCQEEARRHVGELNYAPPEGMDPEKARQRATALLRSDTVLPELDAEWAACMSDEGYAFATPADAVEAVHERLVEAERPEGPPMYIPEEDPGSVMISGPDPALGYYPGLLAQVVEFELTVATADADCRDRIGSGSRYVERLEELFGDD